MEHLKRRVRPTEGMRCHTIDRATPLVFNLPVTVTIGGAVRPYKKYMASIENPHARKRNEAEV